MHGQARQRIRRHKLHDMAGRKGVMVYNMRVYELFTRLEGENVLMIDKDSLRKAGIDTTPRAMCRRDFFFKYRRTPVWDSTIESIRTEVTKGNAGKNTSTLVIIELDTIHTVQTQAAACAACNYERGGKA